MDTANTTQGTVMIPRVTRFTQWRNKEWEPFFPNGTHRYELLSDMWALYDYYRDPMRRITLTEGDALLRRVTEQRVLSHIQIARMTGHSRQRVHLYMQANGHPIASDQSARGIFDPTQIDFLKEMIVRKLATNEYVPSSDIEIASLCGGLNVISALTGIPIRVLRNVKKGILV